MICASPKTMERAIRILEEEIQHVRCCVTDPPKGYHRREWLLDAERRLQEIKRQRLQFSVG